ncbi:MAG: response regulator, partial [Gammaproteobacteria bacterium]
FTVGDLVQYATQTLKNAGCTFTIVSKDGRGGPDRLIYTNQAAGTPAPKTVKQYVTQAGGQRWEMSFFRDTALEHSQLSWPVWWVLISGLLFTSLLGAGLLMLTGRYFRTESLIEERTAQLEKARVAAEAANEAKSRFLANISHELRTPLNAILGFSQLLLKKRTLLKEDYEQINTIKHCSHHLLELITGILDIASIESNKVRTDIKVFDSHNLLTHIVDMCRLNAERKHLKLNIHATAMPRLLWGDQKRIRQVIVNLLDNAIKYTDQGGVALTSEYVDGQWRIIIEDSGRGIAEQDLESIFTPFTQLNEDEFIRPGLGLGLAITRELIHIMGGSITVKSQLGLGSTFAVSLPLRSADDGTLFEPDDSGTAQQAAGSLPVLIADDNQINLLLLANLLELEGCSVDAAANGREALALIESRAYRLALVDLNMPVMSGLELLKSVRSRGNALKMVAVSAYADENRINEALAAGFDAYLTKPIHDEELTALLNSLRA